jgi:hypothetical protein
MKKLLIATAAGLVLALAGCASQPTTPPSNVHTGNHVVFHQASGKLGKLGK